MPIRHAQQFSIRALFLSVAAVGALLAIGNLIGAEWMSLTLWVMLLVIAHVAGAIIGHRRRINGADSAETRDPASLSRGAPLPKLAGSQPGELARPQPLARWVRHLTIGGAVLGALAGLSGMYFVGAATVNGLALGTISAAVLGAFFAFLASSFLAIATSAFDQARRDEQ